MTNENSGFPKEFWIDFKVGPDESTHQTTDVSLMELSFPFKNVIHVIEKSAYDQAIARAEKSEEQNRHMKKRMSRVESLEAEVKRLKTTLRNVRGCILVADTKTMREHCCDIIDQALGGL